MSRPFLARRRPWRLYVLLAAVLVIAVAAGLVAETALGRHPAENFRVPPVVPLTGTSTASAPATRTAGPPGGAGGPLRVLQGRRLAAGGVRTGFPGTLAGAVSAAVQDWSQVGSDLDPARAALIGSAIADPSWHRAPAALAGGVRNTRRGLGLPAGGPVPAGASVALTAVDYQVRGVTARRVTVLLLAYYTTTVPGQQAQTSIGVYPAAMHWARGDWKILAPAASGPDWSGLDAQPGSQQAAADGWQPLDQ
jgi:hypothetical protein